jgi:hypothetical protein
MTTGAFAFGAAQKALRESWGFESFKDGLRSWIATVAVTEVGYVGEWEEWADELWAREYLAEIARRSPGYGAERVAEKVALWDERFRAATVEEAEPYLVPPSGVAEWWWYRSPKEWRQPAQEELAHGEKLTLLAPIPRKNIAALRGDPPSGR